MARRYKYYFREVKTIFHERSTREKNIHIFKLPCNVLFLLNGEKSGQANREHINTEETCTRVFYALHIFHVFTSENMEGRSVLVYGKTPLTI